MSNCVHVILQPHGRWMSHDVTSCADGQEVVQENRRLKKAAGSFPGSFKTSGDGGTQGGNSPCKSELVKYKNLFFFNLAVNAPQIQYRIIFTK